MDILLTLRTWAVRSVAALVVISTCTSTAESYMGLRDWALVHGWPGGGSYLFPGFIDVFPLIGELVLFVAMVEGWPRKSKIVPWVAITGGLVLSVALNTGHLISADINTKITQGMPPVASWISLVVGMAMFELVMANRTVAEPGLAEEPAVVLDQDETLKVPDQDAHDEPDDAHDEPDDELETPATKLDAAIAAFEADLKIGRVPGLNRIRQTVHCGHKNAQLTQDRLKELVETRTLELTS